MEKNFSLRKFLLYVLIFALVLSAGAGIVVLLIGSWGEYEEKVLLTTGSLGMYSIFALSCSLLYDRGRYKAFALAGPLVSALGYLLMLVLIWGERDSVEVLWKYEGSLGIAAFTLAHSCLLLLLVPRHALVRWLLSLTLFFNACFALLCIIILLTEYDGENDFWYRLIGIFAILGVLGTILTPLIHRFVIPAPDKGPDAG